MATNIPRQILLYGLTRQFALFMGHFSIIARLRRIVCFCMTLSLNFPASTKMKINNILPLKAHEKRTKIPLCLVVTEGMIAKTKFD